MKSTLIILYFSILVHFALAQPAHVQVANCSSDSILEEVDIWLDSVKLSDNLAFRHATEYLEIDPSVGHILRICPKSSVDTNGSFYSDSILLNSSEKGIVAITGFLSNGYSPSPDVSLSFFSGAKREASMTDNSDILFLNTVSDVPLVDLREISISNTLIENDLHFAEFTGYKTIEGLNYRVQIQDSAGTKVLREIDFDLSSRGLRDSAFTVVLSGFYDRSINFNGAAMDMHMIPNEGGEFVRFDNTFAKVQIINNSPDPDLSFVDYYLNGQKAIDNQKFRYASGYIDVPAGIQFELAATLPNAISIDDSVLQINASLESGHSYCLVLNGLNNTSISPYRPLKFNFFESQQSANLGYNTDIAFVHGCTDLSNIDVKETSVLSSILFTNVEFGGHTSYSTVPSANYKIDVVPNPASDIILSVDAALSQEEGEAQIWILSGFADTLKSDSTNRVGIWVASIAGGPLVELTKATGINNIDIEPYRVFPTPTTGRLYVTGIKKSTAYHIYDCTGSLIFSGTTTQTEAIDISMMQAGAYWIQIDPDGLNQTGRIILSK